MTRRPARLIFTLFITFTCLYVTQAVPQFWLSRHAFESPILQKLTYMVLLYIGLALSTALTCFPLVFWLSRSLTVAADLYPYALLASTGSWIFAFLSLDFRNQAPSAWITLMVLVHFAIIWLSVRVDTHKSKTFPLQDRVFGWLLFQSLLVLVVYTMTPLICALLSAAFL